MSRVCGSWGGQKAVDDSESCDSRDLEEDDQRWVSLSCGRNTENVSCLADFVLAEILRPLLSLGSPFDGASAWVKMLAWEIPNLFHLNPSHLFLSSHPSCCSSVLLQLWGCAVNGITEIIQVKNNTRGEGSSGFLSQHCYSGESSIEQQSWKLSLNPGIMRIWRILVEMVAGLQILVLLRYF